MNAPRGPRADEALSVLRLELDCLVAVEQSLIAQLAATRRLKIVLTTRIAAEASSIALPGMTARSGGGD